MESLKTLAARSVAARVTSEESLKKLEVPGGLIRDLLVAHGDPWKREDAKDKNQATEIKTMVNLKWCYFTRRVYRTPVMAEERSLKMKNAESTKEKILVGLRIMMSWKECPYCRARPDDQRKLFLHIFQTENCKKKQEQFVITTGGQRVRFNVGDQCS